jgi:hypothetical protein
MSVTSTISLLLFPDDGTDRQAPWWDQHRPFAHFTSQAILHFMSRLAPMFAHPFPTFSSSCNANCIASTLMGLRLSTQICLRRPRRSILTCRLLPDRDMLTELAPHGRLTLSCPPPFRTDFGLIYYNPLLTTNTSSVMLPPEDCRTSGLSARWTTRSRPVLPQTVGERSLLLHLISLDELAIVRVRAWTGYRASARSDTRYIPSTCGYPLRLDAVYLYRLALSLR